MKIIKLSTSPWPLTQEEFNCYTPNNDGVIGDFKYEVNNDCAVCDYWVVRGNIPKRVESVQCPRENVIFLEDEVYEERQYKAEFLAQFSAVVGPRPVSHPKYIRNQEMMPWFFKEKKYKDLIHPMASGSKPKKICLMTSDATWLRGHRERFAFSNKLIGHFQDALDVYGRGFQAFDCKFDILKNYRYCIALENTAYPGYFTEKINECFLSETFPIYFGCPDLDHYYSSEAYATIDIQNFHGSVSRIEKIMNSTLWEDRLAEIIRMKARYFENYHLPRQLADILETNFTQGLRKKKIRIFSESFYIGLSQGYYHLKMGARILAARTVSKISSLL